MSDASASPAPTTGSFAATLLAALGGFVIFILILVVAYLPNRAAPAGDGVKTPAERKSALIELQGKERTAATSYGWIDKDKGVVRLPIDRAIELTLRDHAQK